MGTRTSASWWRPDSFQGFSVHGDLQCTVCHSDIDDLPHPDTLAKVDCSLCHQIESEVYRQSDHGKAVSRGADLCGLLPGLPIGHTSYP